MPVDWSPFVDLVHQHQHFILTTHVRPDGDGLGSMLGLSRALRSMGKKTTLLISSKFPPRYAFLDQENAIARYDPAGDYSSAKVVIVLDTGTWNQLAEMSDFVRNFPGQKVVIDHHQTQDDLDAMALVDTTSEATGRLAFEAIEALGCALDPEGANALFVALAMDTGWFRHNNTSPKTFALAEKLTAAGASPTAMYERLFEQNSPGRIRLTGLVLGRMQIIHQGKIAYTEIHRGDYESVGAVPQDSEDLIDYTRRIAGIEVGLFFMEQPAGGVKISFRSRSRIDVSSIAEQFGGGGHRLASGAVIHTDLETARSQVLKAVQAAIDNTHP